MKRKTGSRRIFIVFGILFALVGALLIWFHIPYSPLKSDFKKDVARELSENKLPDESGVFSKEDFAHLPVSSDRG